MKKKYVKPAAYVEGFEVSSHIATCVWDFNNNVDPENCAADYNTDKIGGVPVTIFTSSVNGCGVITNTVLADEEVCTFIGADEGFTLLHNS